MKRSSILQQLLGDFPVARFLEENYLKLPFARTRGVETWLGDTPPLTIVAEMLASPDLDLVVGRSGAMHDRPTALNLQEAHSLLRQGQTIGVRHIQRNCPVFSELASCFGDELDGAVDIHLYWTASNQPGFGWHYDAEEVFILQLAGSKTWNIRKNTVNPWPLIETIPPDQQYDREIMPIQQCRLIAHDWLYIPAGYWHSTHAGEDSISLSVGIRTPTAIDLFDRLRSQLLSSIEWRQRLPLRRQSLPEFTPHREREYRDIVDRLAEHLKSAMTAETFLQSLMSEER